MAEQAGFQVTTGGYYGSSCTASGTVTACVSEKGIPIWLLNGWKTLPAGEVEHD